MRSPHAKLWLLGLVAALGISVSPRPVVAQATINSALLRGTVQDASHAAVPRATVTATEEARNVSESATTDEQGRYTFNKLRPASATSSARMATVRCCDWGSADET
jgi:uncharacterized protein YfaS (alpha-2-macroglobulin family)